MVSYLTLVPYASSLLRMDQHKIALYKAQLEVERKKLLRELESAEQVTDFGDDIDSLEEESDETEEIANKLAVGSAFRIRIEEIEAALADIASGTYGICTNCKKEISEQVLDLVPESRLCADCKSNR